MMSIATFTVTAAVMFLGISMLALMMDRSNKLKF